MALIHDIEFYGRAVDAGEMARDAAAAALAEASSGGLTAYGAGTSIDNWQTTRAAYQQEFGKAASMLDQIYGLDDIQPWLRRIPKARTRVRRLWMRASCHPSTRSSVSPMTSPRIITKHEHR
jgi:hypothetical protein